MNIGSDFLLGFLYSLEQGSGLRRIKSAAIVNLIQSSLQKLVDNIGFNMLDTAKQLPKLRPLSSTPPFASLMATSTLALRPKKVLRFSCPGHTNCFKASPWMPLARWAGASHGWLTRPRRYHPRWNDGSSNSQQADSER